MTNLRWKPQRRKYLANPSVLEPTLKIEPVSIVSVLGASQLTSGSIIPAFDGLVSYDARSDWGFSIDFRTRVGISSGRHPIGITNKTEVVDSGVSL